MMLRSVLTGLSLASALAAFNACNDSAGSGKQEEEKCTIISFGQTIPCSVWEDFRNMNRPKADSTVQRELATGAAIFWDTTAEMNGEALYGHRLILFHDSVYSVGGNAYNGPRPDIRNLMTGEFVNQGPDYLPFISHFDALVHDDTVYVIRGYNTLAYNPDLTKNILISTRLNQGWKPRPDTLKGYTRRGGSLFELNGYYYSMGGNHINTSDMDAEETNTSALRSTDLIHWERYGTGPDVYHPDRIRAFSADGYAWVYSLNEVFRSRDMQSWEKMRLGNGIDTVETVHLMFKHKDLYVMASWGGGAYYTTRDFKTFTRKFVYDRPGRVGASADNFIVRGDILYLYSSFSSSAFKDTYVRSLDLNRLP